MFESRQVMCFYYQQYSSDESILNPNGLRFHLISAKSMINLIMNDLFGSEILGKFRNVWQQVSKLVQNNPKSKP